MKGEREKKEEDGVASKRISGIITQSELSVEQWREKDKDGGLHRDGQTGQPFPLL